MSVHQKTWYDDVRRFTSILVNIRSVSPGEAENDAAEAVLRLLREDMPDDAYTASGLDPIVGDPWGRVNAYAFIRGDSADTVVLMGHLDTVDTTDYGRFEPWALDPDQLATRLDALAAMTPDVAEDLAAAPGDWMFGRGVSDMKAGVAACIALARRYAHMARSGALPLSLVMIATPDEEVESAGARQAARFLAWLRTREGLRYAGAINTDYITARFLGDDQRPLYTGTVGKVLPCFYAVGAPSHAGDPFAGLDVNRVVAELIREFSMNPEYCESVRGQTTPPPVTLRATDTKQHYDAQLPFTAYLYLNVLTLECSPGDVLAWLRAGAETALARALAGVDAAEEVWNARAGRPRDASTRQTRTGAVTTWAELWRELAERIGEARLEREMTLTAESLPRELDSRERSLRLVERLWTLSERNGPAVVLYFAPPYYPAVPALPSPLLDALRETIAAHPELRLVEEEYFPLLSDMSYLRLDRNIDVDGLRHNMPVWRDEADGVPLSAGAYSLPLDAMRTLDMPVVNIGPYGKAAHQRGERVLMSFGFEAVPQVIYEVIERLAQRSDRVAAQPAE